MGKTLSVGDLMLRIEDELINLNDEAEELTVDVEELEAEIEVIQQQIYDKEAEAEVLYAKVIEVTDTLESIAADQSI